MAIKERWFTNYVAKLPSMKGKTVCITGTTSGTGYWIAVAAIRKNADVCLVLNRPSDRSKASLQNLKAEVNRVNSETNVIQIDCDLMSFASVRKAAKHVEAIVHEKGGLDVLINNAATVYYADVRTEDGFDVQAQVNYLSHFLLSSLLFPSLELAQKSRGDARIMCHSSGARHMGPMEGQYFEKCPEMTLGGDEFSARGRRYGQTKTAISLFTYELNRKLQNANSKILSVGADPGMADTDFKNTIVGDMKNNGQDPKSSWYLYFSDNYFPRQSASDGAMPVLAGAFGKNVSTGDFFAPGGFLNLTGLPKAVIKESKPQWFFGKERNILDEAAGKDLWELSEKAIGHEFTASLSRL